MTAISCLTKDGKIMKKIEQSAPSRCYRVCRCSRKVEGGVTCAFLLFTLFLFFFLFSFRGGCMLCFGTVARNVRGAILLSFFLSF